METPNELESLINEKYVYIPITGIYHWVKKRLQPNDKKKKPRKEHIWRYDGCECVAKSGSRSIPYCNEHYNPLIRKEIK
jgi:hypothetical protein